MRLRILPVLLLTLCSLACDGHEPDKVVGNEEHFGPYDCTAKASGDLDALQLYDVFDGEAIGNVCFLVSLSAESGCPAVLEFYSVDEMLNQKRVGSGDVTPGRKKKICWVGTQEQPITDAVLFCQGGSSDKTTCGGTWVAD